MPPKLYDKYINRFYELIKEGEGIHNDMEVTSNRYESWGGESKIQKTYSVNWERFVEWRTKASSLLSIVVPMNNVNRRAVDNFPLITNQKERLEYAISFLKAIKKDFEDGILANLANQIESEITMDYMGQAEMLLKEGQSGKYDHIPAAVLAGAVLEKTLRHLCTQQEPPIAVVNEKGEPFRLNRLIDELKKAMFYNEAVAKQLRGWADIRNLAAHGEFDQFNRSQVELMIQGINYFLANNSV